MTLIIDPPNAAGHGLLWSHLASDVSFDELHRFARALGIGERGFDKDHYDVPAERYDGVIGLGVLPVSSRELVDRLTSAGLRRRRGGLRAPTAPGRTLQRPARLRPGACVGVVAPSGPVRGDRLDAGIAVLESWGLTVLVGEHVRGVDPSRGYLAADDDDRAADFATVWCDPRVEAVVCARGGYGAQRMVDRVDWAALARSGPKVLVGFSDITCLHQAVAERLGWVSVHGPVVTSLGEDDQAARDHLRLLLTAPEQVLDLTPRPLRVLRPGHAEGVLVGGNLTLLASGVGTAGVRRAAESLVLLEETGEELYRLDRLVTQLLRSGWFEGCRGVVLGDLIGGGDTSAAQALLADRLAVLDVPVLAGDAIGHTPGNLAVPFGVPTVLDASDRGGTLTLTLPALA